MTSTTKANEAVSFGKLGYGMGFTVNQYVLRALSRCDTKIVIDPEREYNVSNQK